MTKVKKNFGRSIGIIQKVRGEGSRGFYRKKVRKSTKREGDSAKESWRKKRQSVIRWERGFKNTILRVTYFLNDL